MNTKTIIPVIVDGNHGCTLWKMPTDRNPHFEPILFDRDSGAYIGHIVPADSIKEGDETVDTVAVAVTEDDIENHGHQHSRRPKRIRPLRDDPCDNPQDLAPRKTLSHLLPTYSPRWEVSGKIKPERKKP
ncbi:hypothetical protein CULC0211_05460 [Corynebacterium ulcerans]|uniref:hypothetical protein n=1 Tax=Corynebacterium ulcerans TaxID=65058 RepID=UPI0012501D1D|nr:hypothetical protein [Corynebacterium ulcerans]BBJ71412.1 hypothetical protein CULC0211_05460 [Corynebacterium ulcerans]